MLDQILRAAAAVLPRLEQQVVAQELPQASLVHQ
jgi:hypothetical protein